MRQFKDIIRDHAPVEWDGHRWEIEWPLSGSSSDSYVSCHIHYYNMNGRRFSYEHELMLGNGVPVSLERISTQKIIYDTYLDEFECPQCKNVEAYQDPVSCYHNKSGVYYFTCSKCNFEMVVHQENVQWESSLD